MMTTRTIVIYSVLALIAGLCMWWSYQINSEPFPEQMVSATVFISNTEKGTIGSGFFLVDDVVVTARHVVENIDHTGYVEPNAIKIGLSFGDPNKLVVEDLFLIKMERFGEFM